MKITKFLGVLLFFALTLSTANAQDQAAAGDFNPVNIWSPVLIGSGTIVSLSGAFMLLQSIELKTDSDTAYATWVADPSSLNERRKNSSVSAYYGSLGFGMALAVLGLGASYAGISIGNGDMDYFLVVPKNTKKASLALSLNPGFAGVHIRL